MNCWVIWRMYDQRWGWGGRKRDGGEGMLVLRPFVSSPSCNRYLVEPQDPIQPTDVATSALFSLDNPAFFFFPFSPPPVPSSTRAHMMWANLKFGRISRRPWYQLWIRHSRERAFLRWTVIGSSVFASIILIKSEFNVDGLAIRILGQLFCCWILCVSSRSCVLDDALEDATSAAYRFWFSTP